MYRKQIIENMIFVWVKFISHKISSNSASSKLDTHLVVM